MRAIITVGLGFGDEGKGATVDFLTRHLSAGLVVRYSGGAQAGHNVELPNGSRHTFAQFGAGTLAGAKTYLGPRMIINPAALVPEAEHLQTLGVAGPWSTLSVHPECLVSTIYHVLMNRLRESARGESRHGSCGLGIGETRQYWLRYGQDALFAKDLHDRRTLLPKLKLLRDRYLLQMQELPQLDFELSGQMHEALPGDEADLLQRASSEMVTASRMPLADTAIFEGAQGVLLDEWNGFHPYTTWSTVTPLHALEMLAEIPDAQTTVLGVTRAYATRHGVGPFPTHCAEMSRQWMDPGNPSNDWQGAIRFGPLDLVLMKYAARVAKVDGIFVNCLDQLTQPPRMVTAYAHLDCLKLPRSLQEQEQLTALLESATPIETPTTEQGILEAISQVAPISGMGYGPTYLDREPVNHSLDSFARIDFDSAAANRAEQGLDRMPTKAHWLHAFRRCGVDQGACAVAR
jgi:adenylosuccinate synthase